LILSRDKALRGAVRSRR